MAQIATLAHANIMVFQVVIRTHLANAAIVFFLTFPTSVTYCRRCFERQYKFVATRLRQYHGFPDFCFTF